MSSIDEVIINKFPNSTNDINIYETLPIDSNNLYDEDSNKSHISTENDTVLNIISDVNVNYDELVRIDHNSVDPIHNHKLLAIDDSMLVEVSSIDKLYHAKNYYECVVSYTNKKITLPLYTIRPKRGESLRLSVSFCDETSKLVKPTNNVVFSVYHHSTEIYKSLLDMYEVSPGYYEFYYTIPDDPTITRLVLVVSSSIHQFKLKGKLIIDCY